MVVVSFFGIDRLIFHKFSSLETSLFLSSQTSLDNQLHFYGSLNTAFNKSIDHITLSYSSLLYSKTYG